MFESRAKTRSKAAIIKHGIISCLGCTQRNCSSCYQVTAEGHHSNPFCQAYHYSLLKDHCSFNCTAFLSPVLGKIQTKRILLFVRQRGDKDGFKPGHVGQPDYGAFAPLILIAQGGTLNCQLDMCHFATSLCNRGHCA